MKKSNPVKKLSGFFLSIFVLSLFASNLQAHTLDIASAQFQWRGGHYSMKLKLDWIDYLEQRLEFEQHVTSDQPEDSHQHSEEKHPSRGKGKLSLLSDADLQTLMEKSQGHFRQHSYLMMDKKHFPLEKIIFPTVREVRAMAQKQLALKIIKKRSSAHHDTSSFFTIGINGNVKNPGKNLSILFPQEIGPVLVTFSSPKSKMQEAGETVSWRLHNEKAINSEFILMKKPLRTVTKMPPPKHPNVKKEHLSHKVAHKSL